MSRAKTLEELKSARNQLTTLDAMCTKVCQSDGLTYIECNYKGIRVRIPVAVPFPVRLLGCQIHFIPAAIDETGEFAVGQMVLESE